MKPSGISIGSLGLDIAVEHPRRKGRADTEDVHVQVHNDSLGLWCMGCNLCSDMYHFVTPSDRRLGRGLAELPHLDAIYQALTEHYVAQRGNLVGAYLEPAVHAMEAVIAARDGSSVYFAYSGGHVKIGYSKRVSARLAELRTGCALPIQLLGTMAGGRALERRLHERFDHLRLDGEWFVAHPELMTHIAAVAAHRATALPAREVT